jgi:plasmid maintenance system antidote protein VapI
VQEARAEKHQLRQRLKTILPKVMTDGRIAIYKLEGRKGRTKSSPRPVISILFQDLEKAMAEQGVTDTGEYVEDRLRDKYGEKGRFLWTAEDSKGRTIPEVGEIEVDLNQSPEDDNMDDDADLSPSEQRELDRLEREERGERSPQFFQQQAPPPPPFDPAIHARQVKEIISEEKRGAESMVTVLMTMMQAQNQQNMLAMQQQVQQAEMRRQEEDRRREREEAKEREERKMELERLRLDQERREKDEQRREDRDRERRQAEQQMQMQFFQSIMNKPDTMTPMLMKMVEGKGDRDGMKELFTLMGEASRHNMQAQGEATKHLLGAQAEAAKTMMANVMGISQTMIQNMVEAQSEPTDDPMEKVARVFKMLAPALGAMSQNAQAAVAQQPQRIQQLPGQPAPPQQRAPVPPAEYIKGGLYTIMRLETGEIPPPKRFEALKWCAENLPKPMLDAIRSGVEDDVMSQGAQGMDANLLGWIQDEQHVEFMRGCIKDVQRMLLGAMTQADAQASYEAHMAYMQAKVQMAQEGVVPATVDAAQVAQPVAPPPANGKRRAPPPAAEPPKDVEQVQAEIKDAVPA